MRLCLHPVDNDASNNKHPFYNVIRVLHIFTLKSFHRNLIYVRYVMRCARSRRYGRGRVFIVKHTLTYCVYVLWGAYIFIFFVSSDNWYCAVMEQGYVERLDNLPKFNLHIINDQANIIRQIWMLCNTQYQATGNSLQLQPTTNSRGPLRLTFKFQAVLFLSISGRFGKIKNRHINFM